MSTPNVKSGQFVLATMENNTSDTAFFRILLPLIPEN